MLTTESKEYIRLCLGNLIDKAKLESGISNLDSYLDYINFEHNDTYGEVINIYSITPPFQLKNHLKSFLNIEMFLGQLADVLNLNDSSRLTPLPSDSKSVNSTKLNWTMERYLKCAFNLFSPDFNLTKDSQPLNINKFDESKVERHILNLYYYRNNISEHFNSGNSISSLSFDEINKYSKSMLFVMIYLVNKYDEDLQTIYQKCSQNQLVKSFDTKAYTNKIIYEYDKNQDFEYLDTRWVFDIDHSNGMTIKQIINENYTNRIIAFIGEAGTGKTTALKRLEYEYAKKCTKNSFRNLPIYIELKNLRASDFALERAIISSLGMCESDAKRIMKDEAIVILLDGFNEIRDKQFAASIRSETENILQANDKLLLFITDRNNKLTQFKSIQSPLYCYLHELSLEEKVNFFKANCKKTTSLDIISQEINKEAENSSSPIIQSLRTPYMLSVFLAYVDKYDSIPDDPIKNYIERLFDREEKEQKDSDDPKHFEQMINVLGALAYKFENTEFRRTDAQHTIAIIKNLYAYQTLDSTECIELSIKMGLLDRSSDNMLRFKSKEFSDYFAIYALATGLDEYINEQE